MDIFPVASMMAFSVTELLYIPPPSITYEAYVLYVQVNHVHDSFGRRGVINHSNTRRTAWHREDATTILDNNKFNPHHNYYHTTFLLASNTTSL